MQACHFLFLIVNFRDFSISKYSPEDLLYIYSPLKIVPNKSSVLSCLRNVNVQNTFQ